MEKKDKKTILKNVLVGFGFALALLISAILIHWNSMLNLLGDAEETVATLSQEEIEALMGTTEPTVPPTTSPEETWPEVVSEENITNIMLVGQNFRVDEQNKLSDTMILCSINRETNTLTMVSFLRDLYVPLPAYAGHGPGRNRINVCYALGSTWKRTSQGGMEMLALCVEQNFGIPVHNTIEISFETFPAIIDSLGGVDVELTEAEAKYMTDEIGYIGDMEPGYQTLDGLEALAYARLRGIDSDRHRAARQRAVITSLLDKLRNVGWLELQSAANYILPMVITDMSNEQITSYLWEFIPMLKDLKIQTLTCPVDNDTLPNSCWGKTLDLYGYPSSVVECNTRLNGEYLRNALGMVEEAAQ